MLLSRRHLRISNDQARAPSSCADALQVHHHLVLLRLPCACLLPPRHNRHRRPGLRVPRQTCTYPGLRKQGRDRRSDQFRARLVSELPQLRSLQPRGPEAHGELSSPAPVRDRAPGDLEYQKKTAQFLRPSAAWSHERVQCRFGDLQRRELALRRSKKAGGRGLLRSVPVRAR